eukprot:13091154-Ditylum_brightwellii.AAC.1
MDECFGSVTSIQSLGSGECIIAKESFGSLRVFDIRHLGTAKHGRASSSHPLLWNLTALSNMIHHTQSIRCTGLTLDPHRCIVVSPFALRSEQNHPTLGVWSLSTGKFLGDSRFFASNSMPNDASCVSSYCELSKAHTNTWTFSPYDGPRGNLIEECRGEWGLFFKCGNILLPIDVPCEAGGIYH